MNKQEHFEQLDKIMIVLQKHKLFAKEINFSFLQHRVEYLGHLISFQGVRTDLKKVVSIISWPKPKSVKALRRFYAFNRVFPKFIRNYGVISFG